MCYVKKVGNKTMGGQGCSKHSMERGRKTLQDEYKKGSSRAKKDRSIFLVESIVDCVE